MNLGPIAKALVGTLIALISAYIASTADGVLSLADILTMIGTVIVAAGSIYGLRNSAQAPYAKALAAALSGAVAVVVTGLLAGDPVSSTLILSGVLALLNGVVVSQVPNAVASDQDGYAEG